MPVQGDRLKKRHRKHLNKLRRRYAEAKENIIRYGNQLNYPVEAITDFNRFYQTPDDPYPIRLLSPRSSMNYAAHPQSYARDPGPGRGGAIA
jgi:hypothetical protein